MKIFEVFNRPYPMTWENGDGYYDALARLGDGSTLSINFNQEFDANQTEEWNVEFWRNHGIGISGEGDQQRVFATVLTAIDQFIDMEHPETIRFTADKDVEPEQKPMSRTNLYDRMVLRYANSWGYRLDRSDMANTTVYLLQRIR